MTRTRVTTRAIIRIGVTGRNESVYYQRHNKHTDRHTREK